MTPLVTIQRGAVLPADDILHGHPTYEALATWYLFSTPSATAWVAHFDKPHDTIRPSFMLYQLDSAAKGHGTILMRTIAEWATMNLIDHGRLVCDPDLIGFYARFDWVHVGDFNGAAEMQWRRPGVTTPGVTVSSLP